MRMRSAGIGLLVVLTGMTAMGAEAQSATTVMVDVGGHYSDRHASVGPTLQVRVGHATAAGIAHHFGIRASAAGARDLICQVRPGTDDCMHQVAESTLVTAFYEPRLTLPWGSGPVRPYVGARVSAARGWDGAGAGAGLGLGLQLVVDRAVVEVGGLSELQKLWPVGPDGYDWTGVSSGLHAGVGWQF